jgi:hypothetical protein
MPLLLTILLVWAAIVLLVLTLCLAAARGSSAYAPSMPEYEPPARQPVAQGLLGGELHSGVVVLGEPPATSLAEDAAHPRVGA